jgi:hypothetical protein
MAIKKSISLALFVVALATLSSPNVTRAQDLPRKVPLLVGTWRVVVDRLPPAPPVVALVTFTSDGTYVRTTDQHPVLSATHGVWTQVSEREFHATGHAFEFDEKGTHIGNLKSSFRVMFGSDVNQQSGTSKVTTNSVDGIVRGTRIAPFRATRIVVEPYVD